MDLIKITPVWYAVPMFDVAGFGLRVYIKVIYKVGTHARSHYLIAVRPAETPFSDFKDKADFVNDTYKSIPDAIQAALAIARAMGLTREEIRNDE